MPACYLNGRPKENGKNIISRMDFEDYKRFIEDTDEMLERMNIKNVYLESPHYNFRSTAMFYDSDSKDTWMRDKDGNIHEFPELNKMLYDTIGRRGLFDTASWAPEDKKVQKRMEEFAQYYSDPEHKWEIKSINLSLNTYHGIMEKANQLKNAHDDEGYKRNKAHYIKNIANAMYTFTPLLDTDVYHVFTKAVPEDEKDIFNDYKPKVLQELIKEALDALEQRYRLDLENKNYKFVENENDIKCLIKNYITKFTYPRTDLSPSMRSNIFSKLEDKYNTYDFIKEQTFE